MAFDPIIACLQQVTDYARYERFCTDLMRFDEFLRIEPLGGVADASRDSVLLRNDENIIFHYSVRKDWKAKLWEDAKGVQRHGHSCTQVVCVNPAQFSTAERDACIAEFEKEFGWPLQLYGIERIATMLRTNAAPLLRAHPQIFVPDLISENREAVVDVRINPTRNQRHQLAQIIAYNRGPGPVLIEAWYAEWADGDSLLAAQSLNCERGRLPHRLREKEKLNILVPLDFEWGGLKKLGVTDADNRLYEATDQSVSAFVSMALAHTPPLPHRTHDPPTLEQVRDQDLAIEVRADRPVGSAHDRLLLVFRNHGHLSLRAESAWIEWTFDTTKSPMANSNIAGPKAACASASVSLRPISHNCVSSRGSEVCFLLEKEMAPVLIEIIARSADIISVEAGVRVAPNLKVTETDHVRDVVTSVAQSILDTWE